MKKLIFNEILLCSLKERRGRKVKFDKKRTLIYGENDTGKSSLIKTIFSTFGATPGKVNSKWKDAKVVSLVKFEVDSVQYSILKQDKLHAIFDQNNNVIKVFEGVTSQLGPFLADLLNFKIKLPNRDGKIIIPPPAFIFLPFYVDQDTGWSASWNSFSNLQQLKNPRESIILYHTGIRPNEYYETKAEIAEYINIISRLSEERQITNDILNNIKQKLLAVDFNIDIDVFKDEVQELVIECEKLKKLEEKNKENLIELHNQRFILKSQLEITQVALHETKRDYAYAVNNLPDSILCPTCGSEYENNFVNRFEIAKQTNRCEELIIELALQIGEIDEKISEENERLTHTMAEIEKIEQILQVKKGDLIFGDILENAGRNEVKKLFADQIYLLNENIRRNTTKKEQAESRLKSHEDRKKRERIQNFYRGKMAGYLDEIDVSSLSPKDYRSVTSKLHDTGSSLARALIAYYHAIFETIKKYSTSVFCPLVIDSPNQQAQDIKHVDKILKFIDQNQPEDTQLILGLEELYDIDFDCTIIELTNKHHVLLKEKFDEVKAELDIYLNQLYRVKGYLF